MIPAALTEAEQLVWQAFPRGTPVDLGGSADGTRPVIRAEVIAALLLGAVSAEPGGAAGIQLRGAAITGPLRLLGGTAAWLLVCESCVFDSGIDLVDSSVRTVRITDSELPAFDATRLRLDGILDLASSRVAGCVRLERAKVTGQLSMRASVAGDAAEAVNLERAVTRSVHGDDLTCHGQLSMTGARIGGDLSLARAVLDAGAGDLALVAERAQVDGTLVLREAKALGEVNLRSIRVGERLLLQRAELRIPSFTAFRLSRAQITADVYCDGLTVAGLLRLAGTVIGGSLTLTNTVLANPGRSALYARNLQAQELVLRPAAPVDGEVDLRNAVIGALRDDPATWPDRLRLDGLTYQALEPLLPAGRRLRWLTRDPDGYLPQPYEQLAAYYAALGQPSQSRDVLYAREQVERRGKGMAARAWGLLQDVTVGYGYRPRRALAWIGLLLAAGSVVFSVAPPPALQAGAAPHFNGIIYTLDLLLPVVNLGQKYAFNPGGAEQWLSYFFIAAGWTLATTVAAGAARVLQRG